MLRVIPGTDGCVNIDVQHPIHKSWIEALRASIQKWKFVRQTTLRHKVGNIGNCPLCVYGDSHSQNNKCAECPVFKRTGALWCGETPYQTLFYDSHTRQSQHSAAAAEVTFLESLLSKKSSPTPRKPKETP